MDFTLISKVNVLKGQFTMLHTDDKKIVNTSRGEGEWVLCAIV